MKNNKKKIFKAAISIILATIVISSAAFVIYTLDYYRATIEADSYTVTREGAMTILQPQNPSGTGYIFYPGGKVEETAYLPLLKQLADEGITCVLVKMPFHLAVFGVNKADAVLESPLLSEIKEWYIGGHSLGGAMASSYMEKHPDELSGLILLAAYPVNQAETPVLAVYGSEDGVLNRDKLTGIDHLVKIEGGNHAYFGDYGEQKGDGTATITRVEQQSQCVREIMDFIEQTVD